jgi:hypothetical protein
MMDHRGRRFKKLFAKQSSPQHDEALSDQSISPTIFEDVHIPVGEINPTDGPIVVPQRRSSLAIRANRSMEQDSPRQSNLDQRSEIGQQETITQLQPVGTGSELLSSLILGGETQTINAPSHVKFSEDIADRNIESSRTGDFSEPSQFSFHDTAVGNQNLLSGGRHIGPIPGFLVRNSVTQDNIIPETVLESAQDAEYETRGISSNPYASIDNYDRKYSQPSRGSQASNVYVRVGRKPTAYAGPIPLEDDIDEDELNTRDTRRKTIVFAQPSISSERRQSSTHQSAHPTNTKYESTSTTVSFPNKEESVRKSIGESSDTESHPLSRDPYPIPAHTNQSKAHSAALFAQSRTPTFDSGPPASQSSTTSSTIERSASLETSSQDSDLIRDTCLEGGVIGDKHLSSPDTLGRRSTMAEKEVSWQELLQHDSSSSDKEYDSQRRSHSAIPATKSSSDEDFGPETQPCGLLSPTETFGTSQSKSSSDFNPILNRYNAAAIDASAAQWGIPHAHTSSGSLSDNSQALRDSLRPGDTDRDVSATTTTTTGAIQGGSRSDFSSEQSLDQGPATPPNNTTNVDKPLPSLPGGSSREHIYTLESSLSQEKQAASREYAVQDSSEPIDPASVVDLSNTTDTTVHTCMAPTVTHETINPSVHNIREEQITREIHNHDVFHRILPIHETEILPPRHFIHDSDNQVIEIPASSIPGRTDLPQNWSVTDPSTSPSPNTSHSAPPKPGKWRPFTARTWHGTEGDAKDYINEDGIHKTEMTWVHPPVLEEGGRLSGQTVPIHFQDGHYIEKKAVPSPYEDGKQVESKSASNYLDDMGGLVEKTPARMPGGWQFDGAYDEHLGQTRRFDIRRKPLESSGKYVKALAARVR